MYAIRSYYDYPASGITYGVTGPDGTKGITVDGNNTYANVGSRQWNVLFDTAKGSSIAWGKLASGTWTDGAVRYLFHPKADDDDTVITSYSIHYTKLYDSNDEFAAEIRKLPRLFALIDDGQLFARERTEREQDFLSLLLKFEQSTSMLTQFAGDAKDISDRFSNASATVSDALVALAAAHS